MFLFFIFFLLTPYNFIKETCKKEDVLNIYKNINNKNLISKLNILLNYCNIHPREVFKLCRKYEKDCSYYKAKLFEFYGNNKDAKDLYLRSNYVNEFLYLNTLEAKNPEPYFTEHKIEDENTKIFFIVLYNYAIGNWDNIIKHRNKILSNNDINKDKLIFYLAYAYIMKAQIEEAKEFLKIDFNNFYSNLEIKKIKALILYSNNEQNQALKLFKEILKYYQNDYISLKYTAEIYFRLAYLNNGLKIINKLIDKEARDTEKYYLLKEKCFMLFRYGLILESLEIADNIIKEYSKNFDFIIDYIVLLLNYSKVELVDKYIIELKNNDSFLYNIALSLKEDYYLNYKNSLAYLINANNIKKTKEIEDKISLYEKIINHKNLVKQNINCDELKIKSSFDDYFSIYSPMTTYFIKLEHNNYAVKLFLNFKLKEGINLKFIDFNNLIKSIEGFWSVYGLNLKIVNNKEAKLINFDYYPSSLYEKRASSSTWQILLNNRVYYHEIGHLLGLKDEYYETNPKLAKLNLTRFIGDKNSIMANILSGNPTKKHIELISSPLQICR